MKFTFHEIYKATIQIVVPYQMYQIKLFGISQKVFSHDTTRCIIQLVHEEHVNKNQCHPSTSKALRNLSSVYLYLFLLLLN